MKQQPCSFLGGRRQRECQAAILDTCQLNLVYCSKQNILQENNLREPNMTDCSIKQHCWHARCCSFVPELNHQAPFEATPLEAWLARVELLHERCCQMWCNIEEGSPVGGRPACEWPGLPNWSWHSLLPPIILYILHPSGGGGGGGLDPWMHLTGGCERSWHGPMQQGVEDGVASSTWAKRTCSSKAALSYEQLVIWLFESAPCLPLS